MYRVSSALRRLIAPLPRLLAAMAYLACILAPLAEAHGDGRPSAPTHVEAQGVNRHYAHDESTCVACVVLSVLGNSSPSHHAVAIVTPTRHLTPPVAPAETPPSTAVSLTYPSRAPPCACPPFVANSSHA